MSQTGLPRTQFWVIGLNGLKNHLNRVSILNFNLRISCALVFRRKLIDVIRKREISSIAIFGLAKI